MSEWIGVVGGIVGTCTAVASWNWKKLRDSLRPRCAGCARYGKTNRKWFWEKKKCEVCRDRIRSEFKTMFRVNRRPPYGS